MKLEDRVQKTTVFPDGTIDTLKGVVVGLKEIDGRQAVEVRWNGRMKASTTFEWADSLEERKV